MDLIIWLWTGGPSHLKLKFRYLVSLFDQLVVLGGAPGWSGFLHLLSVRSEMLVLVVWCHSFIRARVGLSQRSPPCLSYRFEHVYPHNFRALVKWYHLSKGVLGVYLQEWPLDHLPPSTQMCQHNSFCLLMVSIPQKQALSSWEQRLMLRWDSGTEWRP